jgi:hypothetical protein
MRPSASPIYVAARRVLLDALDALADHRSAIILAGAQAIYVRTGSADLDVSVAPFTTDADLALDPRTLGPEPDIVRAMEAAGFLLTAEPGIWTMSTLVSGERVTVPVDLLVPEALAGPGRRAARLPLHGKNAARRTPGLEAAVADHSLVSISSLEPTLDARTTQVSVAGTAALSVAKVHKLHDRFADVKLGKARRLKPKDASDVFRLMRTSAPDEVGKRLREIADDDVAGACVRDGVERLKAMFGGRRTPGVELAVQALQGAVPEQRVRTLAAAFTRSLMESYRA